MKATKAGEEFSADRANLARSVKRGAGGQVQGSTKDPVKAKATAEAAKHGISERTVKRALADDQPDPQRPPKKQAAGKASKAKRATGPTKGSGQNGGDPAAEREAARTKARAQEVESVRRRTSLSWSHHAEDRGGDNCCDHRGADRQDDQHPQDVSPSGCSVDRR